MDEETVRPHVTALYRYPVKGLTPHALDQVALSVGETFPFDRLYAIENGRRRFDPDHPLPLPKTNFLMLMRNARLAALDCAFETGCHTLTVRRNGREVAKGRLDSRLGRSAVEEFFAAYCAEELEGAPRIVHAPGHSFSDKAAKCVHIVNLATLRDLERSIGRPIDPLRFRANIYVDGPEPWSEFEWERIRIGNAGLRFLDRTERCDATNVEPRTGARDMAIPASLRSGFGHGKLGIYAAVAEAGVVKLGDAVTVES